MRTLESHAIVFTKDLTRERFDQGSKEELARVSMYCRKVLVACSRPRRGGYDAESPGCVWRHFGFEPRALGTGL